MKQLECGSAGDWRERFGRDGFLSPIRILDETNGETAINISR